MNTKDVYLSDEDINLILKALGVLGWDDALKLRRLIKEYKYVLLKYE